jgi:peptide/nickel transport system substrate-binding protein
MFRLGLAVLAAVALSPAAARAQAAGDASRVLRIVSPWEITGLDPARSGYVFGRLQVAETIVGADDGGRPVPGLARDWTISDDRLAWRFRLVEGARFHDGSPVTADAVAASLNRAKALPAGVLRNAPIAEIRADGDAVLIRTERPFVSLPAFLAHSSAIVLAPAAYDAAGTVVRMIGSGPYRTTLVEAPLRVEVERFPEWRGEAPAIARASYLAVGRGETRAAMAESGQADLVYVLAPETVDRLKRSPRVAVTVMPIPRTRVVKLNAGLPLFADLRVRQAVSTAIDREGIANALLRSPASTATQMFPKNLAEWHAPDLPPLAHDPAKAKALLAEAGWRPGPDGILAKDGRPFRFTLRTFSDRPELPAVATAIQAQLREVGIDMGVAIVNSGEIPAGHNDGTLEAGLLARNFSLVPDPLGSLLQDYGPKGGDWGAMNWSSPELVDTLAKLGSAADPDERARLRRRVSEILQAELPVIPVAWYDYAVAASRRVGNVGVDPFELSYRISGMRWGQ